MTPDLTSAVIAAERGPPHDIEAFGGNRLGRSFSQNVTLLTFWNRAAFVMLSVFRLSASPI
jgi:hypothetical protein